MMADGDYIIKARDNLWDIAKAQYGDAVIYPKIMKAKGLKNSRLAIDQILKLPE